MGWYRWTDSVSYIFGAYRFWPRLPTCQTVWIQMNVSVHSFRFPWHQFQMRVNAMNRSARYTCRAAPRCTYNVTWASVCIPVFNYTICNIVIGIWHIHMKKKTNSIETIRLRGIFPTNQLIWFGFCAILLRSRLRSSLSLFLFLCAYIQICGFLSPFPPSDSNLLRWTQFQFYSHIAMTFANHTRDHHHKFHYKVNATQIKNQRIIKINEVINIYSKWRVTLLTHIARQTISDEQSQVISHCLYGNTAL